MPTVELREHCGSRGAGARPVPPPPRPGRRGLLLALLLASCASPPFAQAPERPNLVLIIGDDLGYTDYGFMGSPRVRTPHLDRLAREGTVFPVGYSTASVCRPALFSLLTGLEPLQAASRIEAIRGPWAPFVFLRSFPTLPRALADNGYASFQAGKYWEAGPELAGFSAGMGDISQAHRLVRETTEPVYEFIDAHRAKPFFLWFAPLLPHLPHDAPREYLDLYGGEGLGADEHVYYAAISWLDDAVGDLVSFLDSRGLRERTLIVYLADNGWQVEGFNREGRFWDGPRGKYTLYEIGFRTPVIFRWPGHVPAGQTNESLVSFPDVVTTLLGFGGARPDPGVGGIDLRRALASGRRSPRDALIGTMPEVRLDPPGTGRGLGPGGAFLRDRRWRYVLYDDGSEELYDIERDPQESRNLAAEHGDLCADFRARIDGWRAQMKAAPAPGA